MFLVASKLQACENLAGETIVGTCGNKKKQMSSWKFIYKLSITAFFAKKNSSTISTVDKQPACTAIFFPLHCNRIYTLQSSFSKISKVCLKLTSYLAESCVSRHSINWIFFFPCRFIFFLLLIKDNHRCWNQELWTRGFLLNLRLSLKRVGNSLDLNLSYHQC